MPRKRQLRRKHDETYKLLYGHPLVTWELLQRYCRDWAEVEKLDRSTMEKLPTHQITYGAERREPDMLWRIGYRGTSAHMVLLLEFQSAPDPRMAERIDTYARLVHEDLARQKKLGPRGVKPPVLALVLNSGPKAWTEAVTDFGGESEWPDPKLAASQARRQRYHALDIRALGKQELAGPDVTSWLGQMEIDPSTENVLRVLAEVRERFRDPAHEPIRRGFMTWVLGAAETWGISREVLTKVFSLKEAEEMFHGVEMLKEQVRREGREEGMRLGRDEGLAEGMQRGREDGLERGREEILVRMAARKFGQSTAERLCRLLAGADPAWVAEVADAIVECDSGAELLAKIR